MWLQAQPRGVFVPTRLPRATASLTQRDSEPHDKQHPSPSPTPSGQRRAIQQIDVCACSQNARILLCNESRRPVSAQFLKRRESPRFQQFVLSIHSTKQYTRSTDRRRDSQLEGWTEPPSRWRLAFIILLPTCCSILLSCFDLLLTVRSHSS